jgi:hypothetical protein
MSNPWGQKKIVYNTVEDFYREEVGREIGIIMTACGRLAKMLDKLEKTDEKSMVFRATGQIACLRSAMFPEDDEITGE